MEIRRTRVWLVGLLVAWLVGALQNGAWAQQRGSGGPAQEAGRQERSFRGRLPAYYGRVVTAEQRKQIYEIQAKYHEKILELQRQLQELIAKRDAEVEAVLTPEQKAEVERMRREARQRRRSRRSSSGGSPSGTP